MGSQTPPLFPLLIRIAVCAVALTLATTTHTNAVAETWFEDFTDGSFVDDPKLGLQFLGNHELRPEGLVIESLSPGSIAATLAMGPAPSDNWSIRTQARLLQDHGFFGPTVAPGLAASGSFWAEISSVGLGMGNAGGNDAVSGSAQLLDPTTQEDIVIQLDVLAGKAQLWAWAADDPPLEEFAPMLEQKFNLPIGFPGVWVRSLDSESALVLRNLTVATEHIPIPGPELFDPASGDCNNDGSVDASDLSCVSDVPARDAVLGKLNSLPGDFDGDGKVAFGDFLVLSNNFGQEVGYAEGNVNLAGTVDFADFLILSDNFGKTPADVAAVPEPNACVLAWLGLLGIVACRCRSSQSRLWST